MNQKRILIQAGICLAVLVAVQSGIHTKENKFGAFLSQIAEAVKENYTLAELLELGENAAETMASAPAYINDMIVSASAAGMEGLPIDENIEDSVAHVYAVAGGRVIRTGISQGLGLYIMLEHPGSLHSPGKISTYGHLNSVRVITGARVTRGTILGTYSATAEDDFYYTMEDKSGNIS